LKTFERLSLSGFERLSLSGDVAVYILFGLISGLVLWIQLPVGIYSLTGDQWMAASFAAALRNPSSFQSDPELSSHFVQVYQPLFLSILNLLKSVTGSYEASFYVLQFSVLWLALAGFFKLALVLSDHRLVSCLASIAFCLSYISTMFGDTIAFVSVGAAGYARTLYLLIYIYLLGWILKAERKVWHYVVASAILAGLLYVHNLSAAIVGLATYTSILVVHFRSATREEFRRTVAISAGVAVLMTVPYLILLAKEGLFSKANSFSQDFLLAQYHAYLNAQK